MQIHKSKKQRCALFSIIFAAAFAASATWVPAQSTVDSTHAGTPTHYGFPQDWSSRHLVITGATAAQAVEAGSRDPRYVYNMVMRRVALERTHHGPVTRPKRKIDWAISLENGYVPQDQYAAKYQFNVNAYSCNTDYLLLGLTVKSGTQANLVGINNLYTSGTPQCNGGTPWVSFAYNTVSHTGGQINTSPSLSEDGTKVLFTESTSTGSYLHVLVLPSPIPVPPAQDGTVLTPLTPTSCTTPTTAGCMTTLQFSTTSDSNSSPWIDYVSDTAYVGDDGGKLYKIHPVFGGGAPALTNDANWPVTVVTSGTYKVVTDPTVDNVTGRIFMGDANGYLYAISLTAPAHVTSATVSIGWIDQGAGTGIVDGPIVVMDPTYPTNPNQVFSFTGCSNVVGIGGAVNQIPANFTSSTAYTSVDLGSATGAGDCTTSNVHNGTFDNLFWVDGSSQGHMMACGFVNKGGTPSNPQMYFFPFASGLITATGDSTFVINATKGDECSPLTEFDNGASDEAFFGVGKTDGWIEASALATTASTPNCTAPPTSSCVKAPAALGGTSGIIIDNDLANGSNLYFSTLAPGSVNGQKCNIAGGAANPYCVVKLTQAALQ